MSKELASTQPGYWEWVSHPEAGTYIYFNCPCGCRYMDQLSVRKPGEATPNHTSWSWDGNEKLPTLSPSIKRHTPCGFHGHLQAGVWSACSDGAPLAANVFRGTDSGT